MERVWQVLKDPGRGSLWIGLILSAFGLWLLLPGETFAVSASYDTMARFATEEAWGLICLSGSLMLVLGAWRKDPTMISVGAGIATACYFLIWASVTSVNWRSTGTPTYGILMVRSFALWLVWHEDARAERAEFIRWRAERLQRRPEGSQP